MCTNKKLDTNKTTEKTADSDWIFMRKAIDLSLDNVDKGGGPFGAVIVKDGSVIATGVNTVVPDNDPTAHAEINAIRHACATLGTFKLNGTVIYTSCEPCPMCLSAIYWAGIQKVFYGNTKDDAKQIEFDDSFIYEQLAMSCEHRSVECRPLMRAEALEAFRKWHDKSDKIKY